MVRNGKTQNDFAELIGVDRHTVTRWKDEHPEFCAAIELGREDANEDVRRSLLERAKGYSHPAVKIITVSDGKDGAHVEQIPFTQHYPPDTEAAKFWLTNRDPKDWKDKRTQEHTGPNGTPIQIITGVPT
jgi:hypothetical protein